MLEEIIISFGVGTAFIVFIFIKYCDYKLYKARLKKLEREEKPLPYQIGYKLAEAILK